MMFFSVFCFCLCFDFFLCVCVCVTKVNILSVEIRFFVCRVLFLGRLCHSFTEQCSNIKLVMEGQATETKGRATPRLVLIYLVINSVLPELSGLNLYVWVATAPRLLRQTSCEKETEQKFYIKRWIDIQNAQLLCFSLFILQSSSGIQTQSSSLNHTPVDLNLL